MDEIEKIDVEVEVIQMGDEAMLVTDGDTEEWISYSLIEEDSEINEFSEDGDSGTLTIPLWKAEEIGFV